jgi:hypothetical protein
MIFVDVTSINEAICIVVLTYANQIWPCTSVSGDVVFLVDMALEGCCHMTPDGVHLLVNFVSWWGPQ